MTNYFLSLNLITNYYFFCGGFLNKISNKPKIILFLQIVPIIIYGENSIHKE